MKEPRATAAGQPAAPEILSELRVSGHLMLLEPGVFCVVQTPVPGADASTGLPGVRLSQAPNGRPNSVHITGFATDGWLSGHGDAALVRVSGQPAQILVTIYQARDAKEGTAPNLQVMRMLDANGAMLPNLAQAARANGGNGQARPAVGAAALPASGREPKTVEMVAHIQTRGDVGAMLGERLGESGSKRWIEGFALAPVSGVAVADIEYQAVLGPGWLSPWVEGGQFCGSRAMALPVLGLRVRLRGPAAATHQLRYSATFIDGSEVGPVGDGEACESESLAALESFLVELQPRAVAAAAREKSRAAAPVPARKANAAPSRHAAPVAAPIAGAAKPQKKPAARPAPVAEAARRAKAPVPIVKGGKTRR